MGRMREQYGSSRRGNDQREDDRKSSRTRDTKESNSGLVGVMVPVSYKYENDFINAHMVIQPDENGFDFFEDQIDAALEELCGDFQLNLYKKKSQPRGGYRR